MHNWGLCFTVYLTTLACFCFFLHKNIHIVEPAEVEQHFAESVFYLIYENG